MEGKVKVSVWLHGNQEALSVLLNPSDGRIEAEKKRLKECVLEGMGVAKDKQLRCWTEDLMKVYSELVD